MTLTKTRYNKRETARSNYLNAIASNGISRKEFENTNNIIPSSMDQYIFMGFKNAIGNRTATIERYLKVYCTLFDEDIKSIVTHEVVEDNFSIFGCSQCRYYTTRGNCIIYSFDKHDINKPSVINGMMIMDAINPCKYSPKIYGEQMIESGQLLDR